MKRAGSRKQRRSSQRIPKAKPIRRSPEHRIDVTRAEYNRIIDILNERNVILNALRAGLAEVQATCDVQFKRIAQMQAEIDALKRARQSSLMSNTR